MEKLIPISSVDNKKYYLFRPGTTHYDENCFGNPTFVYDFYYLDENFNKHVADRNKDDIEVYASELIKKGLDVVIGPHAPEVEDKHGDFVPNTNPNTLGIWQRPSVKQLEEYKDILSEQSKTMKLA